jgi:hypothetical protein
MGTGRLNAFKAVTCFGNVPDQAAEATLTGTTHFCGDARVRAGKKLKIPAGAILKFHPGDVLKGGVDTSRIEIVVDSGGVLEINGTAANPVQLISFLASPGAQDWYGIVVKKGGSVKANYAQFKNAYAALDYKNSASDTVKNCTFQNNYM